MFSAPSGIPLPPMIARMLNGGQGAVTTTSVAGPDGASAAAPDGAPPAASAAQPATAATESANAASANGSAGENAGGARRGKLELPALERALDDALRDVKAACPLLADQAIHRDPADWALA